MQNRVGVRACVYACRCICRRIVPATVSYSRPRCALLYTSACPTGVSEDKIAGPVCRETAAAAAAAAAPAPAAMAKALPEAIKLAEARRGDVGCAGAQAEWIIEA